MGRVDPFVVQWPSKWLSDRDIQPVIEYLNRFLHDIWVNTSSGTDVGAGTTFQIEVEGNYTVTGDFAEEIVVCNNGSDITTTLPALNAGLRVSITRAGAGGVTIDGNGSTITGENTQIMPDQYDVVNLTATSNEWVLRS